MISTQSLELRAGARLLVNNVTVRINHGDRIGFVGRNGAGKSTLAKVLAGETMPAGGAVNRTGKIGYLPQDPRTGEDQGSVIDRILSVRELDAIAKRMRSVEEEMSTTQGDELEKAMERYGRVEAEFSAAGGYAATAEAEAIAAKLVDLTVSIVTKVGENGKIFGSVNTVQLSEALKKAGFDIDRKSLKIKDEPIKEVGTYEAEANLHKGVKPSFKFEVVGE